MESSTKIAVVGGGLVGSLLACYLARRGYEVHVFDKRRDPRVDQDEGGRSINLAISNRGLRTLREIGLEDAVLRRAIPLVGRFIHSSNGQTQSLLYDPVDKQCIFSVRRQDVNEVLLNEADQMPNLTLHFEHRLIDLSPDTNYMVFKASDGSLVNVSADAIIGADGTHSTVRKILIQTNHLTSYSINCIPHKYLQLTIPSKNNSKMVSNHLHIWPRGEFMMIALPNSDLSWTVTLFMPSSCFEEIAEEKSLIHFFKENFPDSTDVIGEKLLAEQYFSTQPHSLYSVKCQKYHANRVLIIGDAAHAMVPFFGQGMNAGFEDVRILNALLHKSVEEAFEEFSKTRNPDAEAICDLAIYNYVEMRDLVTKKSFLLGRTFDNVLHTLFPARWVPLYKSVTFTDMPYSVCARNQKWRAKILKKVRRTATQFGTASFAFILGWLMSRAAFDPTDTRAYDDFCQMDPK